jgi:hypothetical protein
MRQNTEELAKTMDKEKFNATVEWFNRKKKAIDYCVQAFVWCRKSADFLAADKWIKREWPKIIAEYSPKDTYNADETGLYFRAMPEQTYLSKNESAKGFTSSKERVTVICCANIKGER